MSTDNTYIPRRLDDMWKVGLWDLDVFFVWLVTFGVAQLGFPGFGGMLIGGALGTLAAVRYGRLKADKHQAFILHWVHWHLPAALMHMDRTPPTHVERMVG
ncbi:MAG: type IV conjugative transfer system protein TraL [Burkholderiaceae bacterium]|nr:type IV conjugative transfer system protein TraL [Aquabacterium sp.]NUP87359.1 type IV conjugative transfer system protein TraL [Burkholderiaceae bacterium]